MAPLSPVQAAHSRALPAHHDLGRLVSTNQAPGYASERHVWQIARSPSRWRRRVCRYPEQVVDQRPPGLTTGSQLCTPQLPNCNADTSKPSQELRISHIISSTLNALVSTEFSNRSWLSRVIVSHIAFCRISIVESYCLL